MPDGWLLAKSGRLGNPAVILRNRCDSVVVSSVRLMFRSAARRSLRSLGAAISVGLFDWTTRISGSTKSTHVQGASVRETMELMGRADARATLRAYAPIRDPRKAEVDERLAETMRSAAPTGDRPANRV
jgi:hypothetical protein